MMAPNDTSATTQNQQITLPFCQRWNQQRTSSVSTTTKINPADYIVEQIDTKTAVNFVTTHHYSRKKPSIQARIGMFNIHTRELVGVAIFGVPGNESVIPKYCGVHPRAGTELNRFVLLDSVPGNGETWFLARAFDLLRSINPTIKRIVSYSDPMPRQNAHGEIIKPGHYGTIYQAHNAIFHGRSGKRTIILAPSGEVLSERAICKLKSDDVGARYAYEDFIRHGADRMKPGETGRDYVSRIFQTDARFRKTTHPGNFVYTFCLGDRRERTAYRQATASLPYPKARDSLSMI